MISSSPPPKAVPALLARLRRLGLEDDEIAAVLCVTMRTIQRWRIGQGCSEKHRYGLLVVIKAIEARDKMARFVVLSDV